MKISNLKLRVIGVVLIKDNIAVQSIGFNKFLPLGDPSFVVENLNRYGVDEIVILDINPSKGKKRSSYSKLKQAASYAQIPISIGGGINSIKRVKQLIQECADKVIFNTALITNKPLIKNSIDQLGSQAVIASLDVQYDKKLKDYFCYINGGHTNTNICLKEMIKSVEAMGVGEIFINSIDKDGAKSGYDPRLLKNMVSEKNTPLIACGGVGSHKHLSVPKSLKLSGLAVGNYFNFSEHSVVLSKRYLKDLNYPVRLETQINYKGRTFDKKKSFLPPKEKSLVSLRFKSIKDEKI